MSGPKLYIGFGHKARQGKDSVARLIHATYPAMTRVLGFADALKAYCRVAKGMRAKDATVLQQVGLDERDKRVNIWIEVLEATAAEYVEPIILIPDLRFQNEAEFIRSHEGLCVRVQRTREDGSLYIAEDRDPQHPSENELNEFPWPITIEARDGDMLHLQREAQRLGGAILVAWDHQNKARIAREGPRVVLH